MTTETTPAPRTTVSDRVLNVYMHNDEPRSSVRRFGNTPVPWTVSWTGEDGFFIAPCRFFKRPAICQESNVGNGKPQFGKPHSDRQRQAIAQCLCDLCGKSLKLSTKISLSHARPVPHGAEGWAILQVEPLLHPECAAQCIDWCPSLKRDLAGGTLVIRHVTRWRAQCAVMDEVYVETITGKRVRALGHAKVELLRWRDMSLDELRRKADCPTPITTEGGGDGQ
jgi:hypothetical protein